MNRPAVFFDRDNTLIACDGYLGDPDKVVLVDGAADAVARVRELGFAAVVFSNQSGVARGMFPEEAVHAVNHRLDDLLHEENPRATIDRHDFCPYHPTAKVDRYRIDSDLRKPKPGMIYQAAGVLNLDLKRSWVVGDAPRDIAAGQTAGLRTVLLKIASLPPSPATNEGAGASPDYVAGSLKEAIDFIERNIALPEATPAKEATTTAAPAAEPVKTAVTGDAWTSSPVPATAAASAAPKPPPAEEPVKPTPLSKPTLTIKPAAGRGDPRPDGAKNDGAKNDGARQGGFVVKPNQPPPTGLTWAERMRLAKGGSPLTSAVSAGQPEIPRPTVSQTAAVAEATAAVADEQEVEAPRREVIMRTIPAPVAPQPKPVETPVEVPAVLDEVVTSPAAATEPPVALEAPVAEPQAEAVAVVADSVSLAETVEPAATSTTPAEEASAVERVVVATTAVPSPAVVEPAQPQPQSTAVAAEAPAEPRRGFRREDLVERSESTEMKPESRPAASAGDNSRVEALLEQILLELRRRDDASSADFSVPKLIAGITQVLALAALFISYLNKDTHSFQPTLLVAIALQTLTISLLIMGKQR